MAPFNEEAVKAVDTVNAAMDIVLLGLLIMQVVSGMTREQVLAKISTSSKRTDELLKRLRPIGD